jgi:hypothetical protein
VDQSQVAREIEEVRDLPVVEPGEVDSRGEDPPPRVLRVLDGVASQNSHLEAGVEEHEVDGDFERSPGLVVLGIEEARVLHEDVADLAPRFDASGSEIDGSPSFELGKLEGPPRGRACSKQVGADLGIAQKLGDEMPC